jgi:hypothetical protein
MRTSAVPFGVFAIVRDAIRDHLFAPEIIFGRLADDARYRVRGEDIVGRHVEQDNRGRVR